MGLALKSIFAPSALKQQAGRAYLAVVSQARKPFLYEGYHIPDTLDGRFDAIVLHLFLVTHRLPGEAAFSQQLLECFIADMDRSIREMGVGDTGVGRRVKQMASALLGRIKTYEAGIGDEAALAAALARNVYRASDRAPDHAQRLAQYVLQSETALAAQDAHAIMNGDILFVS
jgi:cytochrome b pre-mRNA-processing protein 3